MSEAAIAEALKLPEDHPVSVATADAAGTPHLACAGALEEADDGSVRVAEWFCPGTVENVAENRRVSLTVWDERSDRGYQMIGEVRRVETLGVLDGYAGDLEDESDIPQVRRGLVVSVERILDFSRAPHSDREE